MCRKKDTRKSFIAKAKAVQVNQWGKPKYCYERVKYRGSKVPVEIRCPSCSSRLPKGELFYFFARPNDHLGSKNRRPRSCPLCVASKKERQIYFALRHMGIEVEFQKTFEDLINPRTNRKLRYDFFLPDQRAAIEYNGIFHKDDKGFAAPVSVQAERFNIKVQYAIDSNIDLIVFDYSDTNLDQKIIDLFTDTTIPNHYV